VYIYNLQTRQSKSYAVKYVATDNVYSGRTSYPEAILPLNYFFVQVGLTPNAYMIGGGDFGNKD
jgi:hypothetical protein